MQKLTWSAALRSGTALSTAALALVAASPAIAQATTQTAAPTAAQTTSDQTAPTNQQNTQVQAPVPVSNANAGSPEQAIVVTGTLLRRTNTETPSPVTILSQDSLVRAGLTNVNDAVRSVSADSAGSISTGFQNGFSGGGAAVSLRGLGVSSSLVLVDGLRTANFPLNDDGHNAYVDLNSIPFSLIDRVEVLKDGASSTYGADAIGGVVNLILKKHVMGVLGNAEYGWTEKGGGRHKRASLTAGWGDYDDQGFNVFINGEYQHDAAIPQRGFPYNTQDLSSIGGVDNNGGDSSLTVNTSTAYVTRVSQTDLNNPLSGMVGSPLTNQYQMINPAACTTGTFTVTTGGAQGTGCKHDLIREFSTTLPEQTRWGIGGRVSIRFADNVEGYVTGLVSHSGVVNVGRGAATPGPTANPGPNFIRATQPFGASPALASSNPGIVLPVYICSAGINCATAADRQLNPYNPYAAAYAADPANGAARIYYQFGDIPFGFTRKNELYRATAGVNGNIGDSWDWRVEGVWARDNYQITDRGYINIANLLKAINTGSYNFANPSQNSVAERQFVSPDRTTQSHSTLASLNASVTHSLAELPGGPLQLAVGGQVRRETLENNNRNFDLSYYTLTTSSAFGKHTVWAGFAELDAPVTRQLDLNLSGRYDHYSEGFSHFSPKAGFKWTPIREFALRGTYSRGFRAPTFAENGPRSQYAGCATFNTANAPAFVAAHGGSTNPYAGSYSLCAGLNGNPNLKPELSRSFTAGIIAQPVRWFSLTLDYYNVKKTDVIVAGPLANAAKAAYYSQTTVAAACAAVAAVGPGYSCNTVDAVDPLFPTALPRVLIINQPFVNSAQQLTSGLDLSATATWRFSPGVRLTSRVEVTDVFKYDLTPGAGAPVQHYVGTMGPYELSSGNGTPKWRGNWQTSLDYGRFTLTGTAYYVGRIKNVAADENLDLSCAHQLYGTGDKFCYISPFIDVDLNAVYRLNDNISFYGNVSNLFNAHAPIAPSSYSGVNYLPTWHINGVIGRAYRVGANFNFGTHRRVRPVEPVMAPPPPPPPPPAPATQTCPDGSVIDAAATCPAPPPPPPPPPPAPERGL
jgi:iron complex outermembrane receptor protein